MSLTFLKFNTTYMLLNYINGIQMRDKLKIQP